MARKSNQKTKMLLLYQLLLEKGDEDHPIPTARLLEGVPIAAGEIAAELCTPTGAALLKLFAGHFGAMPSGTVLGCGYGCGTKDFPRANCVRAFLLDTAASGAGPNDAVTELKANIDDMTGETLGYAMERLLEAGALDVSYIPLQMKKNRPGVLLVCLAARLTRTGWRGRFLPIPAPSASGVRTVPGMRWR